MNREERIKPLRLFALLLLLFLAGYGRYALRTEADWIGQLGGIEENNGMLHIDASNISDGYFLARTMEQTPHRLKLRVEKDEMTFTYDLNGEGNYEVFPLQLGSGGYSVSLYENVGGKKYSQEGTVYLEASLVREDAAFLYPNQYINFKEGTPIADMGSTLCAGMTPAEAYQTVCNFITSDFTYDFIRALTVEAGELPDIDGGFENRSGICQDLSAIMVSILRMQGIASRLMIGYADTSYHAWTETIIDGKEMFFDPTAELDAVSEPEDYSVERYY